MSLKRKERGWDIGGDMSRHTYPLPLLRRSQVSHKKRPTPNQLSLFSQILDRDSIYDILFSFCSPATIIRVSRTCRFARRAAVDYNSRAYNVDKRLRRFFQNPTEFRSLLARTSSIVSGSFALQFFDREFYTESDFDLYVPLDQAVTVGKWIESSDGAGKGYVFQPRVSQEEKIEDCIKNLRADTCHTEKDLFSLEKEYPNPGIGGVYTFTAGETSGGNSGRSEINYADIGKRTTTQNNPLKLQMIVAIDSPMEIILNFHSTVVMNFITHEAAYSLFPRATFEERKTVACRNGRDGRDRDAYQKYYSRGWDYYEPDDESDEEESEEEWDEEESEEEWDEEESEEEWDSRMYKIKMDLKLFQLYESRWVGDKYSWVIPFDTRRIVGGETNYLTLTDRMHIIDEVPASESAFNPITFNGWTATWDHFVKLKFRRVRHSLFKHHYFMPASEGTLTTAEMVIKKLRRIINGLEAAQNHICLLQIAAWVSHRAFFDVELMKFMDVRDPCSCFVLKDGKVFHESNCRNVARIIAVYKHWSDRSLSYRWS